MPRNLHAVIWTRVDGVPRKMGDLVLGEQTCGFTYTEDYRASGLPGCCLLGDPVIWGEDSVVYPISERIPVLPRLVSLIPGRNPRNLQRRHYLDMLRSATGRDPVPGIETEWRLLLLGGHGGIGHVDVFADDISADRWYSDAASGGQVEHAAGRSQIWRMLKRYVRDENVAFDPRIVEQALGPTPTVGGMISKLLVAFDPADPAAPFQRPGAPGRIDVILKVEPPEYAGLLDLEALCLDIHREAGFEVPGHHRFDHDGLRLLAIERFDHRNGAPLPMESLFSVIATGDHAFRETADILLDDLGPICRRLGEVANLRPDTPGQIYRRLLLALLTGNGDLHLDNLSILGGLDACRLAPVYDPAPMRAWPRHDMVSAIPFDAAGHADHGAYFLALGEAFGLVPDEARQCIVDALAATSGFADRVMALASVPPAQRERLVQISQRERALLQRRVA